MKFFLMAASLRKDSLNKKYIQAAASLLKDLHVEVEVGAFESFSAPLYDGDTESAAGVPKSIQLLSQKIENSQAVIISSPEYNGSMPGTLKNTLDWLSRLSPVTLKGKPVLLIGASPGALGAIRGNSHARVPIQALGAYLYPEYLGLSKAHEAFKSDGSLADEDQRKRLLKVLTDFKLFASKFDS